MPDFYYQIKIKSTDMPGIQQWQFPPVFSGKVTADNKKSARMKLEDEYQERLPQRVTSDQFPTAIFLMHLREIKDDDTQVTELFEEKECKQCGNGFRVIDKYNNENERDKGKIFCSRDCRDMHHFSEKGGFFTVGGKSHPVIYRILNKKNGKCYIGQTTQPFTLRWYQHFYHGGESKFHSAIRDSNITDWDFTIVEVLLRTDEADLKENLFQRERFWIDHFDAIRNGYNSIGISVK